MRGAHFGLRVAVLVCGTVGRGSESATRTCCRVESRTILVLTCAAGTGVGLFDAGITVAHDVSGMDDESVPATGCIAEAGGSTAVFDATAWLTDISGYQRRFIGSGAGNP